MLFVGSTQCIARLSLVANEEKGSIFSFSFSFYTRETITTTATNLRTFQKFLWNFISIRKTFAFFTVFKIMKTVSCPLQFKPNSIFFF